jgi:uncharacterized protein (DUF2461 family)
MISQSTCDFLEEASSNHGAEWLDDNRARLDCARRDLIEVTLALVTSTGLIDKRVDEANRDPRKCLSTASISKGTCCIALRVSAVRNAAATYFVQISPHGSYSGGGALLPPPRLARILRQTIASYTGKWDRRGSIISDTFPKWSDGRS